MLLIDCSYEEEDTGICLDAVPSLIDCVGFDGQGFWVFGVAVLGILRQVRAQVHVVRGRSPRMEVLGESRGSNG